MSKINEFTEILTWEEAREYVKKGDQRLYNIIEDISPSKDYQFVKIRYPYGSIIMDNDELFVPTGNGNKTIQLKFSDFPQKIKDALCYRSIPFGFITENTIEIYQEYDDKVFTVALSGPDQGIELGIFEFFGITTCYTVSAGARSVFSLPKISETRHHKRLDAKYSLGLYQPKSNLRHWEVFKGLYNSSEFQTTWETELIFMTKKWDDMLARKKQTMAWERFRNYLDEKGFVHSSLGRKKLILELIWEQLVGAIHQKKLRPDPYTIDTLKQLICIFLEGNPGFRPVTNNFAGPLMEIQDIYLKTYGITHIPTIMQPYHFSYAENKPVYYSMSQPTLLSSTPSIRQLNTIIDEMRSLMEVKKFLISEKFGNIRLNGELLMDKLRKMCLSYFHYESYSYGDIRPSHEIPGLDPDFLFCSQETKLPFAASSSFLKGCIKISGGG